MFIGRRCWDWSHRIWRSNFNKDGAIKFEAGIGTGAGKYMWEGDTVVMTFNTFAPQTPLRLKMEGEVLVEATEFQSDAKLRFKKKQ
jgi:hypothetical protein